MIHASASAAVLNMLTVVGWLSGMPTSTPRAHHADGAGSCNRSSGRLRPYEHRAVSVTPFFSPSHATVSTTPVPSATAVVELEASVFEPAKKPRRWQEIGRSR
jgi:hypothetical protein